MAKQTKRIEDLEIWDDFMFGVVMQKKELCKPLLEMILQVKIKDIKYLELQKTIRNRYDAKGIRLDVFVDDGEETIYNIEIQTTNQKNLPKRIRYYRGMIDLNILEKGRDYSQLKKSYVIFICNYDPFKRGQCIYRFENLCTDDPELKLGDDAVAIIVNPYGNNDAEMGKGFSSFMEYLRSGKVTDAYTELLADEVDSVRSSEEWRREYMLLIERDRENQDIGEKRGAKKTSYKNAENLFKNGATYDLVRKSISRDDLSDEELKNIYDSVMHMI